MSKASFQIYLVSLLSVVSGMMISLLVQTVVHSVRVVCGCSPMGASSPAPPLSMRLLVADFGWTGDPCFGPHSLDDWAHCKLAISSVVVATWAVFDGKQPVVPMVSHYCFEVLPRSKVEGILSWLGMQNREGLDGARCLLFSRYVRFWSRRPC